jgi:hypothetical protein
MHTSAAAALVDQPTGLLHLPVDLLNLIITSAAAPLTICKATASVISSQESVAAWLLNSSKRYPLLTAALHQQWGACMIILASQRKLRQYDLNCTLSLAAHWGNLALVAILWKKGVWAKWEQNRDGLLRAQQTYKDDQERERMTGYNSRELKALQLLPHPLIAAAGAGHLDICSMLLQPEEQPLGLHEPPSLNPSLSLYTKHAALCAAARQGRLAAMHLIIAKEPAVTQPLATQSVL